MDVLDRGSADLSPVPAGGSRDAVVGGAGRDGRWATLAMLGTPTALAVLVVALVGQTREPADQPAVVWLAFGLAGLVTTLVGLSLLRHATRDHRARRSRSLAAAGVVTAIDVRGRRGERGYRETPTVRFTTASGHVLEVRSARGRAGLAIGDTAEVRYDPRDSAWMIVTLGERLDRTLVAAGYATALLLGGAMTAYGAVQLFAA